MDPERMGKVVPLTTDPLVTEHDNWTPGTYVTRGGHWASYARFCRCAAREWSFGDPLHRSECVGFRVVLGAPPAGKGK